MYDFLFIYKLRIVIQNYSKNWFRKFELHIVYLGKKSFLKKSGVKVQCICPAFADTGILEDIGTDALAGKSDKNGYCVLKNR